MWLIIIRTGIIHIEILLLLLLICSSTLLAQNNLQQDYRIFSIEESELSEADKQSLIEDLFYLRQHPANINSADDNTLHTIGLNTFQILCLQQYIKETHPLLSIYELPLINGFTEQDVQKILPYICIKPVNYQPPLHFDSICKYSISDLRLQYKTSFEKPFGFSRTDGKGFIGNNFSGSIRYNFKYYDRLTFSFLADNDEGEPFFTKQQRTGFDFFSANLTLKHLSVIEQITIGDYRLGFAEGLAMNQSLSFGYFSTDAKAKHNYQGIKPNTSIYESNYMRGASTKIKIQDFEFYLFGSCKPIDYSGSILETGLHRTLGELSTKDSNTQSVWGANITWQKRGFQVGATVFHYHYNLSINHKNYSYMRNYFTGKDNNIYSINFCIPIFKRINSFTEIAASQNGGKAMLTGIEYTIAYQTNLTINYRYYSPTYQNDFASAIGTQSRNANEKGLYIAFSQMINPNFNYFAGLDYFVIPNESYCASKQVKGVKIRLETNYMANEKHLFSIFAKLNNRPYNATHSDKSSYPEDNILTQLQLRYTFNPSENMMFKTSVGFSTTKTFYADTARGVFLCQDIILKFKLLKLDLNLRYALFNTDNYDNEFSIYEYGLPFTYSSSYLYDKGQRLYLILRYNFKKNAYLVAKYAITYYFEKNTIHTSNDLIKGKKEQSIALQFYYLFG